MLPPLKPLSSSLDLQGAFAQLSRNGFPSSSLDETLRQLTAAAGRTLHIERVSLWGLTAQRASLECIDLYELSRDRHSAGLTLHAARYPQYFQALERGEPIVADDAMKHPTTQAFTEDYLLMNGISAVINSPIHIKGELQGVLCIERVGPHSAWTSMQRLFAHSIASLVSLAIVQHQLLLIEDELHDANSLQRALFARARDAILISDASTGHVLDANPQAEKLFGRQRHQLLGTPYDELHSPGSGFDIGQLLELADSGGGQTLRSMVVSQDGKAIPVEVVGYEVQLSRGEKVVQGIFRPLADAPAS